MVAGETVLPAQTGLIPEGVQAPAGGQGEEIQKEIRL